MNKDYDYCDTYDSYYNGITLNDKNEIKTFSCNRCNKPKLILKKSVGDPVFKCEECIDQVLQQGSQQQQQQQQQQQEQQQQEETRWKWFGFF